MKRLLVLSLLAFIALVTGCNTQTESKAMYFNGKVIVEYLQQSNLSTKDYLTFNFLEKGEYNVSFSLTKKGRSDANKLPESFTLVVNDRPREYLVTQDILPDFLTVTIENNGVTESNNFQ